MHPLRNGSQATARPAAKPLTGIPGWFTESGDDNVPSYPGADWFNHNIAEFQNALVEMGINFDPSKEDHLAKAFESINNSIGRALKVQVFDSAAEMSLSSNLSLGDMIFLKGYSFAGDGAHHYRKMSLSNDGSGILINEMYANTIADADGVDVAWLGPDVSVNQIRTMIQYSVKLKAKKQASIHDAFSKWSSRLFYPMAYFGDSTVDGATTTGHVPSIPTADGVQINESENAFCKILEGIIRRAIPSYPVGNRIIYNAGFDSQSMSNNFALEKFDSIFIDADAPFVDAKMIGFCWGVTEIISSNNPSLAMSEYKKNLESLLLYSLAKGRQPFLVAPVPLWITGTNDRNGWQLLSIIDEVNADLSSKYNLDILSLRTAIELETNKKGNPLKYFSPDKVHPNDAGQSAIAGGLFAQLCPNVFIKDESVHCAHPKIMLNNYPANIVEKDKFPTDYDYFFGEGNFKFFVYLDEPRILTADSFCKGLRYTISPMTSVTIESYNEKTTQSQNVFSGSFDFYNESFGRLVNSKEFIATLPVGLSEISFTVNHDSFGQMSFDVNTYDVIKQLSPTNVELTHKIDRLSTFSKGLTFHSFDFKLDYPYLCKGTSEFSITAIAFNILNSAICFNVTKDVSKYNYLKLLVNSIEWWVFNNGVHTKKAEATKSVGFDTSTMNNANVRIEIVIGSVVDETSSSDTVVCKVNGVAAYENITGTSLSLLNMKQGFGLGLVDLDINGTLKSLSDVKVVSRK